MNTYYINGNKVAKDFAEARFLAFCTRVNGFDKYEALALWDECQQSEAARRKIDFA